MSKVYAIQEKWDNGCENDSLDTGQVLGDLLDHAYKLERALKTAVTGLEWRKENPPAAFDKADDEKLTNWKLLLGNDK